MRKPFAVAVAAALTLSVAACSSSHNGSTGSNASRASEPATIATGDGSGGTGPATGTPIKIGYANPSAGLYVIGGYDHGADAAVKYVNSQLNGINGHPIELVRCKTAIDSTDPTAQACGQQFANDPSIPFAMTGLLVDGAPFYAPLAAAGKPIFGGHPVSPQDFDAKGVYFFRGGVPTLSLGMGALAMALRPDAKQVNILYTDVATGQYGTKEVKAELGKGVNVKTIPVQPDATNVLPQATALTQDSPDAIVLVGIENICQQVAQAFQTLRPSAPVISNSVCVNDTIAKNGGNIDGWYMSNYDVPADYAGSNSELSQFLSLYPKYASTPATEDFAIDGWSEVLTLRTILSSVHGALTSANVTTALKDFKGPVTLGPVKVSCPGPAHYSAVCALDSPAFVFVWKQGKYYPALPNGTYTVDVATS